MANFTGGRLWFGEFTTLEAIRIASQPPTAVFRTMYPETESKDAVRFSFPITPANYSFDLIKLQRFRNFTGNFKIVGKVQVNTVNSANKWVYIFPQAAPSLCIGAQFTDASGNFSFNNLVEGKYKVYAMDPNFSYNGKLYEYISAVPQ